MSDTAYLLSHTLLGALTRIILCMVVETRNYFLSLQCPRSSKQGLVLLSLILELEVDSH